MKSTPAMAFPVNMLIESFARSMPVAFVTVLLFSTLIVRHQAAPSMEKFRKVYLLTCQSSCDFVANRDEAGQCREQFCPNYVKHLLTGEGTSNSSSWTVVSTDRREIGQFCATWIIQLLEQFDWQYRIRFHLHECLCAAGKDCLVKMN